MSRFLGLSLALAVAAPVFAAGKAPANPLKAKLPRKAGALMPIYAKGLDGKKTVAYIGVTELGGQPARYRIEHCAEGTFNGPCTPIGPNKGGIYTEAEILAARRRMCDSMKFCVAETAVKGAATAGVLAVTIAGAASWGGAVFAAPLCVTEAVVGGTLTSRAATKADDSGRCYEGLSLIQNRAKDRDDMKFVNFANDTLGGGKAIVLDKAKLSQVAQRMGQLLDPAFRETIDGTIDPATPVRYHVPGDE